MSKQPSFDDPMYVKSAVLAQLEELPLAAQIQLLRELLADLVDEQARAKRDTAPPPAEPDNPMGYPPGWHRCRTCGDYALDGKDTCGRADC